jgi:cytochrome c oxidase assembly protein subunit 15
MLTLIVASGATVRLTGSGLGCKHWPGCTAGDPFPSAGYHSDIEFSNRVVASVTIAATLAAFVGALLLPTTRTWLRVAAGTVFFGTLGQAPLGAITVYYHLNPWLVLSHFLLTLAVLGLAVVVALEAFDVRGEPVPARIRQLGLAVGATLAVLVVTGTLATAAGPHSGGTDVRRLGTLQGAVWLHVRAVAVFAISFALLALWLVVRRSRHLRAALTVLGLLVAEMVIGEVQYRTELPWGLVLVHVVLAAVVWVATVAFVARLWRPWRAG